MGSVPAEGWAMESELPSSPVVLLVELWVIWWDAMQEAYTVIPCTSFVGRAERVPIFRIVMPAIAHFQNNGAPPIPIWIGQQISWEVNFFSQLYLQEGCCSFGKKSQNESSAAWNDLPYVLNLDSPDVPRNECDEDFILFSVICGSPAWSWVGIVLWQTASLVMRGLFY